MAAVLEDPRTGQRWPVRVGLLNVVGRTADATICIPDSSLARRHARLELGAGGWTIHDLGSSGGTFVNGKRTISAPLSSADVVILGGRQLRFLDDGLPEEDEDSARALVAAARRMLASGLEPYAAQELTARLLRLEGDIGPVRDAATRASTSPEVAQRLCATFVLGAICRHHRDPVRPALERLVRDDDPQVRIEAVNQLRASTAAPGELLLDALGDLDERVFEAVLASVRALHLDAVARLEQLIPLSAGPRRARLEEALEVERRLRALR